MAHKDLSISRYVRARVDSGINAEEIELLSPLIQKIIELIPNSTYVKAVTNDICSLCRSTLFIQCYTFFLKCLDQSVDPVDFVYWNYHRGLTYGDTIQFFGMLAFTNIKEYRTGKRYGTVVPTTIVSRQSIHASQPALAIEDLKKLRLV